MARGEGDFHRVGTEAGEVLEEREGPGRPSAALPDVGVGALDRRHVGRGRVGLRCGLSHPSLRF